MINPDRQIAVLFVCMGNICRSPAGESVFRHYVRQAGQGDRIRVDSAGTISYHAGNPPDPRMRTAAGKRGYSLDSIARQVTRADLDEFDLIVAMDTENLDNLDYLAGNRLPHVRMLGSFLDDSDHPVLGRSVPDPYYSGEKGFEEVLDMVESACPAMLEHCLQLLEQN